MRLLNNKLVEDGARVHILTGWAEQSVTSAGGWDGFLKQETGVPGRAWHCYRAWLLLDEAQESHWDSVFWAEFFKSIELALDGLCVVIFSSYGSPGSTHRSILRAHIKIPMIFSPGMVISLHPTIMERFPDSNPVGLLFTEEETVDVITRRIAGLGCQELSQDLKRVLFAVTAGHPGALISLLAIFWEIPVSII